jgi:hypothetical protein
MRSIASYQAGKALCRLNWHRKQFVLRPGRSRLNHITQEIENLGRIAREMVPDLRSRELLQSKVHRHWKAFDSDLCLSEDYANWCVQDAFEIHQRVWPDQSVERVAPIRRDYCEKLLGRGEGLVSGLRDLLMSTLEKDPEISQLATSAFVFGEFVEQVRHHPAVEEHMYREKETEPQQDDSADPPRQQDDLADLPDYIANYSPEPGELKVTDSWFLDLQQLWRELGSQNLLGVDDLVKRIRSGRGGSSELIERELMMRSRITLKPTSSTTQLRSSYAEKAVMLWCILLASQTSCDWTLDCS